MKNNTIPFLYAFLLLSIACNSSSSGGGGSNSGQNVDTSIVQGKWSQPCALTGSSGSQQNIFTFTANEADVSSGIYSSNNCSSTPTENLRIHFTYSIPGASSLGNNIYNFNAIPTGTFLTPMTASAASFFNSSSFCGFTNWASGVEKEVTNLTCLNSTTPIGKTVFSIIQVTGNSLQLGADDGSHDGSSVEQRHVILDTTVATKIN